MDPQQQFVMGGVFGLVVGIASQRFFGRGAKAAADEAKDPNSGPLAPPRLERVPGDDSFLERFADANNLSYIPRRNVDRLEDS